MRQLTDIFELTPLEAKIYETLLDLGPSLAGAITRKSGVHRRSVYDVLERLIQKGLVGYIIKNNRRHFESSNPQRLFDLFKEKEAALQTVISQLQARYQQAKEKEETLFYKGKNGLRTVFEDQLEKAKEILVIGASSLAKEILQFYFNHYDARRIQKKIKFKLLYAGSARKERNIKHAEIKYLPRDYKNPATMNIYGDNVAIIHWSRENPFVILIRDKAIAEGYRNHFALLWNIARK